MRCFFLFSKKDILIPSYPDLMVHYLKYFFRVTCRRESLILPVKNNLKKSLQSVFIANINLIIF